jgi:hypothetical protein
MTDPRDPVATAHGAHDLHLIAAAADRDADEATRTAAERQLATCDECASLFADLRAITFGLVELPRAIPVTRDFRISAEQASKLRPAGWRRFLDAFSRAPSLRPIASALTTLGVAGLVLTVALPNAGLALRGGSTGGTSASAPEAVSGGPGPSSGQGAQVPALDTGGKAGSSSNPSTDYGTGSQSGGPGASTAPLVGGGQPGASDGRSSGGAGGGSEAGPGQTSRDTQLLPGEDATPSSPPFGLLVTGSLVLLVLGVGLLLVARSGGRDPTH